MFDRFTDRSRKVIQAAEDIAKERGDFFLGIHHLLIALLKEGNGIATRVLQRMKVDADELCQEISLSEPACGNVLEDCYGILRTPNTVKAIKYANEVAYYLGHNYVGTEHLLLGTLRTDHPAIKLLNKAGVYYEATYDVILNFSADKNTVSKEVIIIDFYRDALNRILKICDKDSDDKHIQKIRKITERAILDGGKWNIS